MANLDGNASTLPGPPPSTAHQPSYTQEDQRIVNQETDRLSQRVHNAPAHQGPAISPIIETPGRNSLVQHTASSDGLSDTNAHHTHQIPPEDNHLSPMREVEDQCRAQSAEDSSQDRHASSLSNPENHQESGEEGPHHQYEKPNQLRFWNPFWLSPTILIILSSLLTLLSAATIVLWRLSVQDHGFELLTTNHYAWTYGPTAVLTIIMSIWTQIAYWAKVLQPWQELKRGPTSAEQSVLLDYISPILPINLWKAGRLRHAAVLLTICVGLILRLVTVASTGLLAPVDTGMPFESITLEASTAFSAAEYDDYIFNIDTQAESVIDYQAYALIAEDLPFPDGIHPSLAFQKFSLPHNSTSNNTLSTIRATVEAYNPIIQCEEAVITPLNASTSALRNKARLEIFSTASWASCSRSQADPTTVHVNFEYSPLERPSRQLFGGISCGPLGCDSVTCGDSYWGVVTTFDVRHNQTSIPDAILRAEPQADSDLWGIQILKATAVTCNVTYSMVDAKVTYDLSQDSLEPSVELPDGPPDGVRFLDGFPASKFYSQVVYDADRTDFMVGNFLTNGGEEFAPDTFFKMMSIVENISESKFVQNPGKMSSAASTVLTYIGVQVANKFLVQDSTLPLEGEISTTASRLQISPLASWSMTAGLILVAASAIALALIRPRDVIPCEIGPIRGMVMVLSHSAEFQNILKDSGRLKTKEIIEAMQPFTFKSSSSSELGFSITPLPKSTSDDGDRRMARNGMEFWKPVPLWPWLFAMTSALPLAIIITLEVLQHLSGRTNGIATIANPDTILVVFGTRFVPASLFLTIAVLYDSIEFNVAVLAPFARLRRGGARGRHTLTQTMLGRFSIEVFVSSLRHRHWAAAFATLAAFLGSFLTISASGLYTIEKRPGPSSVTVNRVDQFDPSWSDSLKDDGGAAVLLTDFELLNLSYPAWTSDELAFPEIRLSPTEIARINDTSQPFIAVRVPAVRGELQCRFSPPDTWRSGSGSKLVVNGSVPIPAGCDVESSTVQWSSRQYLNFYEGGPGVPILGQMLDLHPGDSNYTFGELTLPLQDNSPPGCPSLAFTFGNFSIQRLIDFSDDSPEPPDVFTTMSCYQLMAEIQTDVILSVPDFRVSSAVPDESTIKYLASGPNGETEFGWRPQVHFELEVTIWDSNVSFGGFGSPSVVQLYDNPNYNIDGFFALLLQPGRGFYAEEMLGAGNQDRLLDGIQSVYRRYMAQVASAKMRVPAGAASAQERYTATWENPKRGVLRQSNGSKLVLQVLLAVMFVCGVAAYLLVETGEVLPHDPCSIAGLASLLAASSMCSGEPAAGGQTERSSTQDDAYWDSTLFSLGWWESPACEGGRFGIDAGEAQWVGRNART